MPGDQRMADVLSAQDNLYTVVTKADDVVTPRVIGSMIDYRFAPDDQEAVLAKMASPETRIVSLTVTEKGYHYDPVTDSLAATDAVQFDVANKAAPRTAPGMIVAALQRRRDAGLGPFTVLSCDNLEGNGKVAKRVVVALAHEMEGPGLAEWIETHGAFPNSMVDRITPATDDADIAFLRDTYGVGDGWPVVCEEFRQWVVEDAFCAGRPDWENAGAMFVPDVFPYELMKLRLLNTSHSALAYVAYLAGHRIVDRAMAAAPIQAFVGAYMGEVRPSCLAVPGVCLDTYQAKLLERFGNTGVADQLQRLAEDGSTKMGNQMRPIVAENLEAGRPVAVSAIAVAAYLQYMTGTDLEGGAIAIKDPKASVLQPLARDAVCSGDSSAFVTELFGHEVGSAARFTGEVSGSLAVLREQGVEAALAALR
jgi:mannitol 2-dehydrogenase